MTATAVSICSNALLILGAQTINALDEDNDRARLASNLYATVRDNMLRAHPWNCAIKRVQLAPDADRPAFGYARKFTLPGDWLRTIEIEGTFDFTIEGRSILSDSEAINLRYVYRNAVESTWDAALVEVMTLAMAARMAYAITQSTSMEQSRMQELEYTLRKARAVDGQEEPPQTFGDFPLLVGRFTSGGVL